MREELDAVGKTLRALTLFVSNLSPDFKETVIIAQHLAPHAKSMMVELISHHWPLPVIAAENGEMLQAAHV
jgi:two-component system CheB/CheR fusion protein